jgi:hypothetical protein
MGLALPNKRITVNMASADLLKEGSHFDLPIAIGLLAAMDALPMDEIGAYMVLGELGLDGGLTRVTGVLPAAIHANASGRGLICLGVQGPEAAWAGEVEVLAGRRLVQAVQLVKRIAQVAMIGGGGGIVPNGLPDQFHGGSVIADLMGDDAEQVVGVGMNPIEPEHPPVGGLGVRQLPGLVHPQPLL